MQSQSFLATCFAIGACALGLTGSAAAQFSEPVGGYTRPLWEVGGVELYGQGQVCSDLTGDGIEDIHLQSEGRDWILSGVDGEVWLQGPVGFSNKPSSVVEDLDGDGQGDFVLRNGRYSTPMANEVGAISVIQGGSGKLLWSKTGTSAEEELGGRFNLIDLDGDGLKDVLSHLPGDYLHALSGKTGATLWKQPLGRANRMKEFADWNGDGVGELLSIGLSRLELRDGASGSLIWTHGNNVVNYGESSETDIVDLTADGFDDILIRNYQHDHGGYSQAGAMQLIDGMTGLLVWEEFGVQKNDRLGRIAMFFDPDIDGKLDVFAPGVIEQRAFDGSSGAVLWSKSETVAGGGGPDWQGTDFNQDGVTDWLCRLHDPQGWRALAVDGRSGSDLWETQSSDPNAVISELHIADLNTDGTPDVVATIPMAVGGGEVLALDGGNGSELWSQAGGVGLEYFAWDSAVYMSPAGEALVIYTQATSYSDSSIFALNGSTGDQAWQLHRPPWSYYHRWHWDDLDQDGSLELINFSEFYLATMIIDLQTGTVRNTHMGEHFFAEMIGTMSDIDGDGWREIVSHSRLAGPDNKLQVHSGLQNRYTTGLTLIGDQLSVSQGGIVGIGVEFELGKRNHYYRLLMSAHGVGPTQVGGVQVPLTEDRIFTRMNNGNYPSSIYPATGRLDNNAEAMIAIQAAPNSIPSALIGHDVYVAVIAEKENGTTMFSSGAEAISILP